MSIFQKTVPVVNGNLVSGSNPMPVSGTLTGVEVSSLPASALTPKTATVSSSGDTVFHTPASGKSLRLYYLGYSADGANSADVTVYVKFGSGSAIYKQSLAAKAMFAHTIAANRYVQGGVNQALSVNLSAAQTVHVNVEYEEV